MKYVQFFFTLVLLSFPALAETPDTGAEEAYIVDYQTGTVLLSKNPEQQMPTSSMSKVITALAVFEALEEGRLSLDDELTVSEKAWRKQGSKMFVEVGKQVTVEDLLRGVIVQSGNDATIVLAEGLAGTEDAFAQRLNNLAQKIGMEDSNFTNASGWPDPDHYSTAKDLAIMTRYLIENYPEKYEYYSETEFTYNGIKQGNRNPLLYRNLGADGVKTGHTEDGGYGLIGSAENEGRRVIMVLNGMDSSNQRAEEAARLMAWALRNFENRTLFEQGDIVEQARVAYGETSRVGLQLENDIMLTLPVAKSGDITARVVYEGPLNAPVEQGSRIGTLTIEIPEFETFEYPLVAAQSVEEQGFFAKTMNRIKNYLWQQL